MERFQHFDGVFFWFVGSIGESDAEVVLDGSRSEHGVGDTGTGDDFGVKGELGREHDQEEGGGCEDQHWIDQRASAQPGVRFSFECVLAAVSDESFGFFDTAHDIVASVDALGAMDAFHL